MGVQLTQQISRWKEEGWKDVTSESGDQLIGYGKRGD